MLGWNARWRLLGMRIGSPATTKNCYVPTFARRARTIEGRRCIKLAAMKTSIFISHAAPEDNAFTRWLGAKLELAGYAVWHDLDRLKGGDYFWDKIEEAIREQSFRLLAVASKSSIHKQGVKNEWALGTTLERSNPGFVIPLRIDDLDYQLMPIEIHRKNAIDFAHGWHNGLSSLLDTLTDAKAPKKTVADPSAATQWLPELKPGAILRADRSEKLDSTWLPLLSLPPTLETARILGTARGVVVTPSNRGIPWFEHENWIVGFAKSADMVSLIDGSGSAILRASSSFATDNYINEGSFGEQHVRPAEARKRVSNLVRQAWELAMEAKGFSIHEQSGGRKVFYATPKQTKGQRIAFVDVDGRTRRKALHGRSDKRNANWSYGVGIAPAFEDPWRIELRSTIVFAEDDWRPMESVVRSHRLRRSFCRSWWNDKWRGFLRAFLALASEGAPEIRLPVGSDRHIVVGASPLIFIAPFAMSDLAPLVDADAVDESDDDFDDDAGEVDAFDEDEAAR